MIGVVVVLVTITVLLLSAIWLEFGKVDKSLPPGPGGFPFVGNLVQLALRGPIPLTLRQWALKYGKIYTLKFPGRTVFVLNDLNIMKDILGRKAAVGRPRVRPEIIKMLFWSGEHGVLTASGNEWLEQRQFFVRTLQKFGFGREGRMKELVLAEAGKLCERIASKIELGKDNRMVFNDVVDECTGNIMWSMITGQVTDSKEPNKLVALIDEVMSFLPSLWKTGVMRSFKHIAPEKSGYKRATEICAQAQECIERQFKENEKTIICGEPPRDVIDAYIKKVEQCQDVGSTFFGEAGKKHSYANALSIMIGGADTTGAMLTWIIYYLSVHGHVQKKLQMEIDSVIGKDREPTLEDKERMPYMEAVTLEALRFSSMVPSGGMIALMEDVKIGNYLLPKGSHVLSNLFFVQQDKKIWGDPEKFRPERFLDDENQHMKDFNVAFQMGRRVCPGERFAKDIIFLFVAKLFQTFDFDVDSSIKNAADYLVPAPGVVRKAKKFALVVTRRQ